MTSNPSIGDLLSREEALGLINHIGVLVAPNAVLQNTLAKGEHVTDLKGFASGQPVKVLRMAANPSDVVTRARRTLAKPRAYDLFARNCEHTAFEVAHGIARSPQLVFWLMVSIIVLLVIWARR